MKGLLVTLPLALAAALPALAQDARTNTANPPIAGPAAGQLPPGFQAISPKPSTITVVRERPYYGGTVPALAQGRLFPRMSNPRSPVQNPEVDLSTGRPRGIVLFSWNF